MSKNSRTASEDRLPSQGAMSTRGVSGDVLGATGQSAGSASEKQTIEFKVDDLDRQVARRAAVGSDVSLYETPTDVHVLLGRDVLGRVPLEFRPRVKRIMTGSHSAHVFEVSERGVFIRVEY